MMSCTRIYVEPTEDLMDQAREKRLAHDKNLMTVHFMAPLRCGNIRPQKKENCFKDYLNFPNRSHSFLPVRRPWGHFCSEEKRGFSRVGLIKDIIIE